MKKAPDAAGVPTLSEPLSGEEETPSATLSEESMQVCQQAGDCTSPMEFSTFRLLTSMLFPAAEAAAELPALIAAWASNI